MMHAESRPGEGVYVFDDVLGDPHAYRAAALQADFRTIDVGPAAFHGIALGAGDSSVPAWIVAHFPLLEPRMTLFRRSPAGQLEPHYIHADLDMGDWTAILYLNPDAPEGDGTAFWRHRLSGQIATSTQGREAAIPDEWVAWRDLAQWDRWHLVPARFNRLLLFRSALFHSRAIAANYGAGDDARLIQVVFGTGVLAPEESVCR